MARLNKDEMARLLERFLADSLDWLFNNRIPPQKRQLVLVLVADYRHAILKVNGHHDVVCVVKEYNELPQGFAGLGGEA